MVQVRDINVILLEDIMFNYEGHIYITFNIISVILMTNILLKQKNEVQLKVPVESTTLKHTLLI